MTSNAQNVLRWTLGGALIAGSAGFLVMLVRGLMAGDDTKGWLNLYVLIGIVAGVLGGAVGAFAEILVHTRRRR